MSRGAFQFRADQEWLDWITEAALATHDSVAAWLKEAAEEKMLRDGYGKPPNEEKRAKRK